MQKHITDLLLRSVQTKSGLKRKDHCKNLFVFSEKKLKSKLQ